MNGNPTITAAIIARDAARNLAELLPLLQWTDEIVVVDGGSRDATRRIARSGGCRVVSRRFDNFARQRNHALALATGPWVLSIDADERPTPRLVDEIRQRIARGRHDAFRVPIRSSIFGRPLRRSGTQDDRPVRLFRRDAARWVGDVHEVLPVSGRIGRLQNWLTHDPLPDLETFLAKMHRYTLLEAKARAAAGRRPTWRDTWIAPPLEVCRRLIWKQGFLDGPAGWAFCVLSGLSTWILAREHHRLTKPPTPVTPGTTKPRPPVAPGTIKPRPPVAPGTIKPRPVVAPSSVKRTLAHLPVATTGRGFVVGRSG